MGNDTDTMAVVDQYLRVRGVKNLRVIDASIMPKIVSGNTNAPTIMIGEKGADFIKNDWLNGVGPPLASAPGTTFTTSTPPSTGGSGDTGTGGAGGSGGTSPGSGSGASSASPNSIHNVQVNFQINNNN